jgi:hypothetical protein
MVQAHAKAMSGATIQTRRRDWRRSRLGGRALAGMEAAGERCGWDEADLRG